MTKLLIQKQIGYSYTFSMAHAACMAHLCYYVEQQEG